MPTRTRWWILLLLFAVTTNNYLDRIVLNTLSPVILADLHMDKEQYGWVSGAFQLCYAFGFLLMGKLIDSAGTRAGYAWSIIVWSIAAGLHALSRSFLDLGIYRALLGLGESGNFPAAIKAVTEWFPKKDRAFATGIFNAGTTVAAMVGPPLFVWMSTTFGWRVCFLITASTGAICLVWWWTYYRVPQQHPGVNAAELAIIHDDAAESREPNISWTAALRHKETWGFALAKFFSDPVWWFYLTWLALYFSEVRGLKLSQIGWALPVVYLTSGLGSIAGGWLSGFFLRRGWPNGRARKVAMAVFALCMPVAATAILAPNVATAVALIGLATAAHQAWAANLYTTVSDVFPKNAVASVTGIGGAAGGFAGFLFSAVLPGYIIQHFGYAPMFVIMGVFHPIAWLCVHYLLGRMEKITTAAA